MASVLTARNTTPTPVHFGASERRSRCVETSESKETEPADGPPKGIVQVYVERIFVAADQEIPKMLTLCGQLNQSSYTAIGSRGFLVEVMRETELAIAFALN